VKWPKCSIVRDACGTSKSGASGKKDDEARWIVAQIAQKSSASFAGCCVGFCCDEGALDVVALGLTESLASFLRWMCPNERASCSAIAASATQVLHRLLVRTQRIGKTRQPQLEQSTAKPMPGNTFTARGPYRPA
jgi:hypothetical protein